MQFDIHAEIPFVIPPNGYACLSSITPRRGIDMRSLTLHTTQQRPLQINDNVIFLYDTGTLIIGKLSECIGIATHLVHSKSDCVIVS